MMIPTSRPAGDNLIQAKQQLFNRLTGLLAQGKPISPGDDQWLRSYLTQYEDSEAKAEWLNILDRFVPTKPAEQGFPERRAGDTGGNNTLRRTNWFNGRYLTAGALSQQDVYFHHRSLLNAQAQMPGVAWGLGIEAVGTAVLSKTKAMVRQQGTERFILRRGLAFDGIGQPILVSQDFNFTLADLSGVSPKTPRQVVVGGQREFMPCVCLAPDPRGASGGSPALSNGPYLLVIEAGEEAVDRAKASRDLCGGRPTAQCEADAWQGCFGLSLVRFPVDVTLPTAIEDGEEWPLRGMLSAYYFDVFEHPLWSRWDPPFPVDGSFSRDSGPGRHGGTAIPLAMVYLEGNKLLFIDSWIPRRVICATPGEDWHRTRFGAPPRAAAWARLHQFQSMLQESLKDQPMLGDRNSGRVARLAIAVGGAYATPAWPARNLDLYSRGFRHIPPIGFLPLTPRTLDPRTTGSERADGTKQACTYFTQQLHLDPPVGIYLGNEATFNTREQGVYTESSNGFGIRANMPLTIQPRFPAESATLHFKKVDRQYDEQNAIITLKDSNYTMSFSASEAFDGINIPYSFRELEITTPWPVWLYSFCYSYTVRSIQSVASESSRSFLVSEALRQGRAYFESTNVFVYGVAALHDDDILEDLHNVIDKDPIQLERLLPRDNAEEAMITRERYGEYASRDQTMQSEADAFRAVRTDPATYLPRQIEEALLPGFSNGRLSLSRFLTELGGRLHRGGLEIDELVNRRTEVVKLIVPLQGLTRRHPLLDVFPGDAATQLTAWGAPPDISSGALAGLLKRMGLDLFPRPFVVYVKQRLVLLDLVLEVVETMQELVSSGLMGEFEADSSGKKAELSAAGFRAKVSSLPEAGQRKIRFIFAQKAVQELIVPIMAAEIPDVMKGNQAFRFLQGVEEAKNGLPPTIQDPGERSQRALVQLVDDWAAEYPDLQVLQFLAAVQPPEQTLALVRQLGSQTTSFAGTVADELQIQPTPFRSEASRVMYSNVRRCLEKRPLTEVVEGLPPVGLPTSLTVGDVLARSPQEAERLVGGAPNLEKVREAFLLDRQDAIKAAAGLADGVPQELLTRLQASIDSGGPPSKAIETVRQEEIAKPQKNEQLLAKIGHTATLLRLGGNRLEVLRGLRRQPGG
jgi:hypothetical protein